jgi:hypothetical protein
MAIHRREMLCRSGMGLGGLALAGLLADQEARGDARSSRHPGPHFAPRARRMIHLFMNGGPSHVDTFDPKPVLARYAGQELPTGNLPTERKTGAAMPSPYKFRKYGQSGIEPAASTTWPSSAPCTPTSPTTNHPCC